MMGTTSGTWISAGATVILAFAALLAITLPAGEALGEEAISFTPSAQYRPRIYHREGHNFADGGTTNTVAHRARIGLKAEAPGAAVFVQVQDVRLFGEEGDTLNDYSADGLDVHQAYGSVFPTKGLELRLGRQEIAFENHRLIGTVGWTERARSFDAARITLSRERLKVDAFYSKVREDAAPSPEPDATIDDLDLLALNVHYNVAPFLSVGLVGVADLEAGTGRKRVTAGIIATGAPCDCFSYSAEGYYQGGGADGDVTYAAWLAAAKARYTAPVSLKPFIELFAEALSGDDDPTDTDVKVFDTLYATNHKFYGEMDFYLNTPKHTGGRGLVDVGAAAGLNILDNLAAKATGHYFTAADDQGAGESVFGSEVDVRLDWKVGPHVKLDLVYAVYLPGEIMESSTGGSDPEHFAYSTLDVSF